MGSTPAGGRRRIGPGSTLGGASGGTSDGSAGSRGPVRLGADDRAANGGRDPGAAGPARGRPARGRPISSSSQPAIMAVMLDQLDVRPGQRVLEIGTGTGYNAALLAELVGGSGAVTTVDIDADLVEQAGRNLDAAGVGGVDVVRGDGSAGGVDVVRGDGSAGWPDAAPYDRIILTAAARDLAPAWL